MPCYMEPRGMNQTSKLMPMPLVSNTGSKNIHNHHKREMLDLKEHKSRPKRWSLLKYIVSPSPTPKSQFFLLEILRGRGLLE